MFQKSKGLHVKFSARFLVVTFAALIFSHSATAQFADTPCDPNYYRSLEARAWLEAQREITQNQNLIFKPDSVLEYTCFDQHLGVLSDGAANMFSETNRWGGNVLTSPVAQDRHMSNALTSLISGALTAYDEANFGSDLLGGRITAWPPIPPPLVNGGATSYTPQSAVVDTIYSCDIMQAVWMKAKCMNFIDNPAEDGFFSFEDYRDEPDKRYLPSRCGGGTPLAAWLTNINIATDVDSDPIIHTTPWEPDNVVTYLDNFFPPAAAPGCTGNACCGTGLNRVVTGLVVADYTRQQPYFYNEHVCLVPGCHWEPAGAGPNAGSPATGGACTR